MAKDPAFLFYSSDFITGVAFMSDEQVGKYIRLLCMQHLHGRLSEKHMMHICKTYDADIFAKFKKDANGLYFNQRADDEINKRKNFTESRKANRISKKDIISSTYEKHMIDHMENENINENINIDDNEKRKLKSIDDRQNDFLNSLRLFHPTYTKEMLTEFFEYWTEPNKSKSKMRFEMEKTWDSSKRLKTWFNNSKKFNNGNSKTQQTRVSPKITDNELYEAFAKRNNGW